MTARRWREALRALRDLPAFIASVGVSLDQDREARDSELLAGVESLRRTSDLVALVGDGDDEGSDQVVLRERDRFQHVHAGGEGFVASAEGADGGVYSGGESSEIGGQVHAAQRKTPPEVIVPAPFDVGWYCVETSTVNGQRVVVVTTRDGVSYLTPREAEDLARALYVGLAYIGFPAERAESGKSIKDLAGVRA